MAITQEPTLVLSADRLFDGTGAGTINRPRLRIRAGQVVEDTPGAVETVDFPGCTILPGLIDTHVHLVFCAAPTHAEIVTQVGRETDGELLTRALGNARAALGAGITTVRDCGGRGRVIQEARDRIRRGEAEGADVFACGAPITTRMGHCNWLGLIAEGEEEAAHAAEKMLNEGADFLKIMATGGNMTPSSDPMRAQYDVATVCRVADIGRAANRFTAAHVLSRSAMPAAVAARVRTIEHCNWRVEPTRFAFDPELARRIRDQDQFVGFTMSGFARRALVPEVRGMSPDKLWEDRFASERQTIDAGVPYTIHSDAGVGMTPIDRFAQGLRCAAVELALTPSEVLVSVTGTAARAIGLADRGTLALGKRADLIVVEGNPLADLACLEKIRAVMKAGRWVQRLR